MNYNYSHQNMKKIRITLIFCLMNFSLLAQVSKIENTRVKITTSLDTMLIKYDLKGKREAFNLKLDVKDQYNGIIHPKNISGDIGKYIKPGNDKTILWNMNADGIDLSGSQLKVKVLGNVFIPTVKKKAWIPWLYIAAGASAITGTYAYLQANHLYQSYNPSLNTLEAENIHSKVDQNLMLSRVTYGAAAVFGVAGVLVHIKHNRNKRSLSFNFIPLKDVNIVYLTYKF